MKNIMQLDINIHLRVYWWNNGIIEKMCKEQPGKDFKMGRIKNK
jgi:hypothetical protein